MVTMVKSSAKQETQEWIDACKRHRLSQPQMQMARALGMNPKKLGKLDNHRNERWKLPLGEFIEDLYFRRFGEKGPVIVPPAEESVRNREQARKPGRSASKSPKRRLCTADAVNGTAYPRSD